MQLLNGLGYKYNPITMTISAKLDTYSFSEVSSLLLTVDKNLEQHNSEIMPTNTVVGSNNNKKNSESYRPGYGFNY